MANVRDVIPMIMLQYTRLYLPSSLSLTGSEEASFHESYSPKETNSSRNPRELGVKFLCTQPSDFWLILLFQPHETLNRGPN